MILRLLLFPLCIVSAAAAPFDDANRQFQSGDFAGAAAAYEEILTADGPDAAVYFNLGNSYQSLGRPGPAILAYERARLLTPRDPDLLANLALARKAAAAFEETGDFPRLQAVLGKLSRNEWSRLVAGAAMLLGAIAVTCGAVRLPARLRRLAIVSSVLAALAIAAGSAALYLRRGEVRRGVILSENAAVRISPFEQAESLGTAGPGRIVLLGAASRGYRFAEIPGTSLRGWLAEKDVAAVAPADGRIQAGLSK